MKNLYFVLGLFFVLTSNLSAQTSAAARTQISLNNGWQDKTISQNEYFFKPFKEMNFSRPNIKTEITPRNQNFVVTLTSDKAAKDVYLSVLNDDGSFADNYFTLIPGRKTEVEFRANGKMSVEDFRRKLKIRSLIDAF